MIFRFRKILFNSSSVKSVLLPYNDSVDKDCSKIINYSNYRKFYNLPTELDGLHWILN